MGGDNMKKTLSILMALLLLWSMALPAAAAETAAAATLRLEKAEGTVKVSNASGKSVTVTDGMRLYSGYTIATEKNSYAYVSLDSTKAVKLDASSKAEVEKSGKKLELKVTAGKLFFNVTAPVGQDESLNIRTSTMVTGVRGTSGWVVVIGPFHLPRPFAGGHADGHQLGACYRANAAGDHHRRPDRHGSPE